MPDSPDTCGRNPNPQRKSCGLKNVRFRVGRGLSNDDDDNDSVIKATGLDQQNNDFARVHFFVVVARQRCETV